MIFILLTYVPINNRIEARETGRKTIYHCAKVGPFQ